MGETLLGRDGHLHDLAVDRHLSGDLDDGGRREVEQHLTACAECRERVAAAVSEEATFEALPVPDFSALPEPANTPWRGSRWLALAAAATVAVGLGVSMNRDPAFQRDDVRLKGDGLLLEVFVDGSPPRQLASGDEVVPGDRLGFRVRSARDGELFILGVDEAGTVYPCLPAREAPPVAHPRSEAPVDVQAAVVLDAVLGTEQLVAVHCADAVGWRVVANALADDGPGVAELVPGCSHDVVTLDKVRARRSP
ncbi:MAG: hypothetical protein ACI8PZ_005781 [Myxococcota bacterium]|jgi:hypothetical protein